MPSATATHGRCADNGGDHRRLVAPQARRHHVCAAPPALHLGRSSSRAMTLAVFILDLCGAGPVVVCPPRPPVTTSAEFSAAGVLKGNVMLPKKRPRRRQKRAPTSQPYNPHRLDLHGPAAVPQRQNVGGAEHAPDTLNLQLNRAAAVRTCSANCEATRGLQPTRLRSGSAVHDGR